MNTVRNAERFYVTVNAKPYGGAFLPSEAAAIAHAKTAKAELPNADVVAWCENGAGQTFEVWENADVAPVPAGSPPRSEFAPVPAPKAAPEDHGRANALAWFASIVEMVDRLRKVEKALQDADDADHGDTDGEAQKAADGARQAIHESALSVELRSDWYVLDRTEAHPPAEFRILLTWGGPALQLTGELSEHGEPESARLEFQDWGTPWTELSVADLIGGGEFRALQTAEEFSNACDKAREYLLDFARQFYFGEG